MWRKIKSRHLAHSQSNGSLDNQSASSLNFYENSNASLPTNEPNGPTNANNKTVWNWFTQNRLVNTFVEKIVTTVDPQMKEYIRNETFLLVSFNVWRCKE